MLLRKRRDLQDEVRIPFGQPVWDDKTVQSICESERFDVWITKSIHRHTIGGHRGDEPLAQPEDQGFEIFGVLTYPKYIAVSVSFQPSKPFGLWYYNRMDREKYHGNEVSIPLLEISIADPDGHVVRTIHEGHRDALLCGRTGSLVRFWKRIGDGVMSDTDRQHDYSYDSRYPIFGLIAWSDLGSEKLPAWALPPGDERFSLDRIPEWYDLGRELGHI